jgi:ribosomal protein L37AE/L43A
MYPDYDDFAEPGGRSALRRAHKHNPRNLPCPTCNEPNRLTPRDQAQGYQCDECADRAERGGY